MQPKVIYVHGAFISDAQWWWQPVAGLLAEHGIESHAVDLPSTGDAAPLGDLHDDAAAVRAAIEAADGPVIVVGHSYGGAVVSEAADGLAGKVGHLVFISAVVADGQAIAQSDYISDEQKADPGGHLEIRDDGTVGEGAQQYKTRVLESLPSVDMTNEAVKRLTRQSTACFFQAPEGRAWKDIPSSYIMCQYDADVDLPQQRAQAARTGEVVEVPTNHFAHLERPDLVAEVILRAAKSMQDEPAKELV